jgi:hypothetical protein
VTNLLTRRAPHVENPSRLHRARLVPRIVERLRRMLAWNEQRRTRAGTGPPPITLPKLGGSSPGTMSSLPPIYALHRRELVGPDEDPRLGRRQLRRTGSGSGP